MDTGMGQQHFSDGIRLDAEVVSTGGTGKSLESLEGGNREEKISPILTEREKAPSVGQEGKRQAGLSEVRQCTDGQGGLTSSLPVPRASIRF